MIADIERRIGQGGSITFEEALMLENISGKELEDLLAAAYRVNLCWNGRQMDLCSIINAKSGKCTEDCKFCAQSAHYQTGVDSFPLLDQKQVLERAFKMEAAGVKRYSLVTAGKGATGNQFEKILEIYKVLRSETGLQLCASLGIVKEAQLRRLKEVGVTTYHHNLETSRFYYSEICTTHSYQERVETIKAAQKVGLRVCSGGIIGLGESWRDRVELAFQLKELEVDSVPVNILHPIKGTPLEGQFPLQPEEILKTLALFRLTLPKAMLRLAGGREYGLGENLSRALLGGVNALLVGNYLTTSGRTIEKDIAAVLSSGFIVQ